MPTKKQIDAAAKAINEIAEIDYPDHDQGGPFVHNVEACAIAALEAAEAVAKPESQ